MKTALAICFPRLRCRTRSLGRSLASLTGSMLFGSLFALASFWATAYAQVTTNITGDGTLGTNVTQNGNIQAITGGTRKGANLFHSFGEFNVGAGDTAMFQNTPAAPVTNNVLGRVTGGNISSVFGTIDTATHFPGANLFLTNPAGWVFGPNAALNVSGSVNFTTADYLKQSDGVRFTSLPSDQDSQLSVAAIAAFGFLEANPAPITVNGSTLSVTEGHSISLVSGNITIGSGLSEPGGEVRLASVDSPGGEVRLASVDSPGEILNPSFDSAPNINGESFTEMGTIALLEGTTLNVSSDGAGTVLIRGGELVMTKATISADTGDSNGAATAVDIQLTDDLSIEADFNPAITAKTSGSGNAGEIQIASDNMIVDASTAPFLTVIDTVTSGSGQAGNVNIATGDLQVTTDPFGFVQFIDSGTASTGPGGNVTINAESFTIEGGASQISTGDNFNFFELGLFPSGPAGHVIIVADEMNLTTTIFTSSFSNEAGNITLEGGDINLDQSDILAQGLDRGGEILIQADSFIASKSEVSSTTDLGMGPGAGIMVTADVVEMTEGSQFVTSTFGDGDAGAIQVTATDHVSFLGSDPDANQPSGIFSNSFGDFGTMGKAGNISITTPRLEMTDGARINTATASSGLGGGVTIDADSISISGQQDVAPAEIFFGLGNPFASGIITSTLGDTTTCAGPCGDAGGISITTGSLTMENGAQMDSGTSSTGNGGTISVDATENISISGTLDDGTPGGVFSRTIGTDPGSGNGGNISLATEQNFSLNNGAEVSASSTGPGNSGTVTITASSNMQTSNGTVSTSATEALGGDISITAGQNFQLTNDSTVLAESDGPGNSGGVTLTATDGNFQSVDSTVSTSAQQAEGGDITITAGQNVQLVNNTTISAESFGPGDAGDVTVTSGNNIQMVNSAIRTNAAAADGGNIKLTGSEYHSTC